MKASEYKAYKGLRKESLRDNMTDIEIALTSSDDIKINYIARTYSNFTIPSYDSFYYLEKDLRGYAIEYEREKAKYFQQTVLSYKDGMYSENSYGISFHNNKEEYFNHDNSFEIISSIL